MAHRLMHTRRIAIVCLLATSRAAWAQVDPPGCNVPPSINITTFLGSFPYEDVQHGEFVDYTIYVQLPEQVCRVTNLRVRFWLPGDPNVHPGDICSEGLNSSGWTAGRPESNLSDRHTFRRMQWG